MNTDSKQRAATFELALEYAVRRMIEIDALCHGTNYCPGCRDKYLDIEEAVECAKSHFLFEAKRAFLYSTQTISSDRDIGTSS